MAMFYLLFRYDLIPDVIRPVGFLDDFAVLFYLLVWRKLKRPARSTNSADAGRTSHRSGSKHSAELDPWSVFALPQTASLDQVKHRYRELLAKYHPDKVSHLGSEFQEIAHEKVLELQAAYEAICAMRHEP